MVAEKFLTIDNLSPAVKNVQYAVRGKIVIRAGELEKELKQVCKICIFFAEKIIFLSTCLGQRVA